MCKLGGSKYFIGLALLWSNVVLGPSAVELLQQHLRSGDISTPEKFVAHFEPKNIPIIRKYVDRSIQIEEELSALRSKQYERDWEGVPRDVGLDKLDEELYSKLAWEKKTGDRVQWELAQAYYKELFQVHLKFINGKPAPTSSQIREFLEFPRFFTVPLHNNWDDPWHTVGGTEELEGVTIKSGESLAYASYEAMLFKISERFLANVDTVEDWMNIATFRPRATAEYEDLRRWMQNEYLPRAIAVSKDLNWLDKLSGTHRAANEVYSDSSRISALQNILSALAPAERTPETLVKLALAHLSGDFLEKQARTEVAIRLSRAKSQMSSFTGEELALDTSENSPRVARDVSRILESQFPILVEIILAQQKLGAKLDISLSSLKRLQEVVRPRSLYVQVDWSTAKGNRASVRFVPDNCVSAFGRVSNGFKYLRSQLRRQLQKATTWGSIP